MQADFVIERSGAYWFQLTDVEGLTGGTDTRWEIRAVPDAPPTVSIEQPTANLFVTPQADVPLRIAAKDDLAVRRVELAFGRSDRPQEGETIIELHVGPDRAEPRSGGFSADAPLGESLSVDYRWSLGEMRLQPGGAAPDDHHARGVGPANCRSADVDPLGAVPGAPDARAGPAPGWGS
jgi:hypothetical protein